VLHGWRGQAEERAQAVVAFGFGGADRESYGSARGCEQRRGELGGVGQGMSYLRGGKNWRGQLP
jgi:hypothetical protein